MKHKQKGKERSVAIRSSNCNPKLLHFLASLMNMDSFVEQGLACLISDRNSHRYCIGCVYWDPIESDKKFLRNVYKS